MRRSYLRVCLTAALALLASLAFSGVASASHGGNLHCGDVLNTTTDITLTGNVGPCGAASGTNGALTITASGTATDYVTLDLAGYKVFGCDNVNPTGPCNEPSVDVADQSLVAPFVTGEGPGIVIDGKDYVKITDSSSTPTASGTGTVSDFDTGIVIRGGQQNVIEKVDVKNNVGSALTNSDYGEGIGIYTSSGGATATGSTNNKVTGNNIEGNGPYAGVALYNFHDASGAQAPACATTANTVGGATAADGNTVKNNYVVPNGTTYQDDGIRVEPDVCNSVVQNNTVTGSSLDGIAVFAKATGTQVKDNFVRGNGSQPLPTQRKGDGIRVFQTANGSTTNPCTVSGNTVGGSNSGTTVPASPPPSSVEGNAGNGIRVDAHTCTVNGNSVTGNGYNVLVNGTPVPDPRGIADPESQYRYYDLRDGQTDKACGSSATNPAGGIRNYWGNVTTNMSGGASGTYGTRNRDLAPAVRYCIE